MKDNINHNIVFITVTGIFRAGAFVRIITTFPKHYWTNPGKFALDSGLAALKKYRIYSVVRQAFPFSIPEKQIGPSYKISLDFRIVLNRKNNPSSSLITLYMYLVMYLGKFHKGNLSYN